MYSCWDTRTCIVSQLYWFRLQDLVEYVQAVRKTILQSTITKGPQAQLPTLTWVDCPATQENRFPRDDSYLCQGIGQIGLTLIFCV
ncbi:hypothetical protein BDF14DRAFT_1909976 [Spinellus fusiger]|nr:hypothetical protein BDF14DRAFT_1909976 [Spinellus fusiger]